MDDQRPLVHVRLETAAKLSEAKAYPLASTTSCVGCESTSRADVPPLLAQDEPELGPENWPTTVQAIAADILGSLSDEDKATLRKTKKDDLIMFHHGWGMGIRNHYGLWRGNDKLIESACGKGCLPDDASMVIIEAVWSALQHEG